MNALESLNNLDSDERDWAQLTADQFAEGYADGDDIYDDLPVR